MRFSTICFLLSILIFGSCGEIELQELKDFTLSFETSNDTIIQLNWTEVNHAEFEHYTIIRSTEPIPAVEEPHGYFVLAQIQDLNTNNFEDVITKLSPSYYYKVFAKIGDRYLYTENTHIHFDEVTPLTIQRDNNILKTTYQWNNFDVTSFQRYIISFSTLPIQPNQLFSNDVQTIVLTDRNLTSFINEAADTLPQYHYYTFAIDLGDRLLFSGSISSTGTDIFAIAFNYQNITHNPNINHIYFQGINRLVTLNYETKQIEGNHLLAFNAPIDAQTIDGAHEVIFFNNTAEQIQIFQVGDNPQNSLNIPTEFFGYKVLGHHDWVLTHENTNNGGFLIYDRTTQQKIGHHLIPNNFHAARSLTQLSSSTNEFIMFLPQMLLYFELDNNANILTQNTLPIPHTSNVLINTAVSPDGQYFIGTDDGKILDKNLQNPYSIIHNDPFTAYTFSADGSKLYATTANTLYQFSFPNLQIEQSEAVAFQVDYIVKTTNELMLVGKDNDIGHILIEYIDL